MGSARLFFYINRTFGGEIPKVGDLFNLSIWWSDISSQLFPNREEKKLLVGTKSFPQIMLDRSPEQQEKVHTQGSVTNLMALNLIWKHSK